MHDTVNLETAGLPSVFVASEPFRDAAAAQSRSLGFSPAGVFVRHPIQDRTNGEMRDIADQAVAALIAALTNG